MERNTTVYVMVLYIHMIFMISMTFLKKYQLQEG